MSARSDTVGLQTVERKPTILHVAPGQNLTWPSEDQLLNYTVLGGRKIASGFYAMFSSIVILSYY